MRNLIIIFMFFITTHIFSEIIILKDGKTIKGRISRQTITKVEIILSDQKTQILEKNQISKIIYITEEELKKQEEERKKLLNIQQEKKKKEEELRRLEEELKRQQEERQRFEEEKRKLEEEQRVQELQRLEEEERKRQEELIRLEEQRKKQEEEKKALEQQEIATSKEISSGFSLEPKLGFAVGSENTEIKKYFDFYNFHTDLLQNQSSYVQNHQLQMKSPPLWNWGGGSTFGLSIHSKNWRYGILTNFYYQQVNPKLLSIINQKLVQNQPYFDIYSENRYNFLKYKNLYMNYFIQLKTEELFSFFWYYILPYLEFGYYQRDFEYNARLSSTKVVSTNTTQIANTFITNLALNNQLQSNAVTIGIPFRFLMIFDSEFLFVLDLYLFGKNQLRQITNESNFLQDQLANFLRTDSKMTGKFYGQTIKFIWQNTFYQSSRITQIFYMSLYKSEWRNTIEKKDILNYLFTQNLNFYYINEFFLLPYQLLYKNHDSYNSLKETQLFLEFGLKIKYNL